MLYLNPVGLAGDNDLQNAEIGSIVDFIVDIGKSCENVMKETDEAKKVCTYVYITRWYWCWYGNTSEVNN